MIAVIHRKTSALKLRILDLDFPTQVTQVFFLSSLPLGGVVGYHLVEYKTQASRTEDIGQPGEPRTVEKNPVSNGSLMYLKFDLSFKTEKFIEYYEKLL